MAAEIEITGTDQLRRLADRFREAAAGGLQEDLSRGMDDGSATLRSRARLSALEHLPKRGGLNLIVADAHMSVRRIDRLHLRIVADGIAQLARTNAGSVQHPTYGHRPRVTQELPKARDWFFRPMRNGTDEVRRGLLHGMERTGRRITS